MSDFVFFSRPSPKAGREPQTALNRRINKGGPLASWRRSPGRESTQRLCTCLCSFYYKKLEAAANQKQIFQEGLTLNDKCIFKCSVLVFFPHFFKAINPSLAGKRPKWIIRVSF